MQHLMARPCVGARHGAHNDNAGWRRVRDRVRAHAQQIGCCPDESWLLSWTKLRPRGAAFWAKAGLERRREIMKAEKYFILLTVCFEALSLVSRRFTNSSMILFKFPAWVIRSNFSKYEENIHSMMLITLHRLANTSSLLYSLVRYLEGCGCSSFN